MIELEKSSINELELSTRGYNCLRRANIRTISELSTLITLGPSALRNAGPKTWKEIETAFTKYLEARQVTLSEVTTEKTPQQETNDTRQITQPTQQSMTMDIKQDTPNLPFNKIPSGPEPNTSSIQLELDLSADQIELKENSLAEIIQVWLSFLAERQQQIIIWRYGLFDNRPKTLEEIGLQLDLTRERVRQLESKAIRKLKQPSKCRIVQPFVQLMQQIIFAEGGICAETYLGEVLTEAVKIGDIDPSGAVRLLLDTHNGFSKLKKMQAWGLSDLPLNLVSEINRNLIKILTAEQAPLSKTDLLIRLKATPLYQKYAAHLNNTFIFACIKINQMIVDTGNESYGLEKWERYYQDDIILALRHIGKPAHFSKIAEIINANLPPERHITPRGVHIRLLHRPDLFVWVGLRGTYGLKEWGVERSLSYEETLAQILQQSGYPLTYQQILAKLPEFRPYYDETSILLTIATNKRFRSFPSGTYGLAEWQEDEFVTEDYRLQRLFDGIEVNSSTKIKPKVLEALNNVDNFIARIKGKSTDAS